MALFAIRYARLDEKPTWGQVWRRVLTKVFGKEGLHDYYYGRYHLTGSVDTNASVSVLTKLKLYNPFKLLIEFPLTLLHDIADRACQMGADEPEEYIQNKVSYRYTAPTYGLIRTLFRWSVRAIFGLPLAIAKHFTSPINTIIRPLIQEAQHNTGRFLLLFGIVALLTIIVAAGVFTGGLAGLGSIGLFAGAGKVATVLSFIPGATQLAAASGVLSSTITAAVSGASMAMFGVNLAWLVLTAQIGLVVTAAVAAFSILPQIVPQIRDKITLGTSSFTKAEFRAEGLETACQDIDPRSNLVPYLMPYRDKEYSLYSKAEIKETTYSRFHFNTAGNDNDGEPVKGIKPSDYTNGYSWGSFFGIFGTIDGQRPKAVYEAKQKAQMQQEDAAEAAAKDAREQPISIF